MMTVQAYSLSEELVNKIKERAKAEGRNASNYVAYHMTKAVNSDD